jgi:LmbE family N-acetylglucosaminyl deacetylase
MTEETQTEEFTRGMVVVAHADDAEFGCSGTVAKLCSEGWEMVYVLCTDGSKGSSDRDMTQAKLSSIRREEQAEAGKVLGLKDVAFLDHEDSMLQPTLELRKDIAREIRRHRPDVLITPYPARSMDGKGWGVGHPDHIAAGEAALSAVFPSARDYMTFPDLLEAGFEPHKVAEAWIMGHPEPDHWVDVTEHMDTSLNALFKHSSQLGGRPEDEIREMMKKGRRERAVGKGMQYAEAFRKFTFNR